MVYFHNGCFDLAFPIVHLKDFLHSFDTHTHPQSLWRGSGGKRNVNVEKLYKVIINFTVFYWTLVVHSLWLKNCTREYYAKWFLCTNKRSVYCKQESKVRVKLEKSQEEIITHVRVIIIILLHSHFTKYSSV